MPADSFVAFYRRYYSLVLTVAQQRLAGVADAEDAAAEVFRIAWARDRAGGALTLPWLYQVLRNVVGNEYRRLGRAPALTEEFSDDQWRNVLETKADDAIAVRGCMNSLPAADRELLFMAYWEDLSRHEIAQILGCSVAAVRVRLLRARRRLARQLDVSSHQDAWGEEVV